MYYRSLIVPVEGPPKWSDTAAIAVSTAEVSRLLGSELIKHDYDDKYQCYPHVIVIMMGKQTALV